ncbi:SpoIID/LytB domain-containing protein [Pseudalkalibacillus hwajinpoensis]|uniref:SpoIID/LytB domain-containing protein n=1 Tax=Guptibacillus hwajinpoensis TaxID=208199 RepID=A0A4U1MJG6_9BACL|nr:SpoIID/LytB domain-containing protein [Pseudalkalibacillus hwajinpoensis]TKD70957.1 SpoIID/LytB domain-containing protein [Pseudalkalibacillus hwajinpoensis]
MKIFTSLLVGILAFSLSMHGVQAAGDTVSVKLVNYIKNSNSLSFNVYGSYQIEGSEIVLDSNRLDQYHVKAEGSNVVLYMGDSKLKDFGSSMKLVPTVTNAMDSYVELGGKRYLGGMEFKVEGNYIRPVNTLSMEEYLKGVVPSEMPAYWGNNGGMEALKAQVVAARTFALPRKDSLTDSQSSQVYKGYDWYATTNEAIDDTAGQVLKYDNKYIGAFYSSTNGGMVMSNTNSWGSKLIPYLQTKADPYDEKMVTRYDYWEYTLGKQQIDANKLDLKKPETWWANVSELSSNVTEIKNIKTWLTSKSKIGKTDEIKITDISNISFTLPPFKSDEVLKGSMTINYFLKNKDGFVFDSNGELKKHTMTIQDSSYNIRFMVGTTIMKSPYVKNIQDKGDSFVVSGSGYGHGIGMSQYGAYQQSKEGRTHDQILSFYYPGTDLVTEVNSSFINRLAGNNRYETSVEISKAGWKQASDVVVLGRGDLSVDALTGSVLAKKHNAPLLLTTSNKLPSVVEAELDRLKPEKVYILGGPAAISEEVYKQLTTKGYIAKIDRISGANRYETSVAVANEIGNSNQIFVTTGDGKSPDALSIAPYAASKQIPIVLTATEKLSGATADYMTAANPVKTTIIGGENAVSNAVRDQLATSSTVDRVAGANRYETSVRIAQTFDFENKGVFFANGDVFIDALPGSPFAAAMGAPVILTKQNTLSTEVEQYLESTLSREFYFLGGEAAISKPIEDRVSKLAK